MAATSPISATAVACAAALLAVLICSIAPLASPLLIALVIGAVVANSPLAHHSAVVDQPRTTRMLLRLGVVLLGIKLPLSDIVGIGIGGILVIALTVIGTYGFTVWFGDLLRLDSRLVTLIAAGFSICGAAAIAAIDDAVKARQKDVAMAVALVTMFGSAMILVLPYLAGVLGLSDRQAAVWAGASIHEVAQVVAAASMLGTGALAIAMTIKLGRVALLAPMYGVASRRGGTSADTKAPLIPWFVIGFVAAVTIRSSGLLSDDLIAATGAATTFLLAAGMFGLGIGIRAKDLWPVPANVVLLATASTVVAAGGSLLLVILWI